MSLPAEPASAAVARRFVRDVLATWNAGQLEDTAVLLTSELVTNALLHARSAPELNLRLTDGCLRVGVSDGTPLVPVRKRYGKEAATGRGLLLIETLASAWGTEPNDSGKEVWFELATLDEIRDHVSTEAGVGTDHDGSGAGGGHTAHTAPDRRRPPGGPRARTGRPPARLRPATRR